VLNVGILAVAWFKAWRPLNIAGFVFTFAIGTGWGVLKYAMLGFAAQAVVALPHPSVDGGWLARGSAKEGSLWTTPEGLLKRSARAATSLPGTSPKCPNAD
jgi:uncharacterized membrane protein